MKDTKLDMELLHKILHIETCSYECGAMQDFLLKHAEEMGYDWEHDASGNIYLTKGMGATYPCMVAHMDTVHEIHGKGITLVTIDDKVTGFNASEMRQCGIGGDDKCGIYAALHCMNHLSLCKAAFFVDEEVGCVGSYDCDLAFFEDCRFILQADRRGNDDFVTHISGPLSSKKFLKDADPILEKFGYDHCHGMMSDVMALRDQFVGVSCANMSAGYYNPHSEQEYIDLVDLENVCLMMEAMGREMTSSYPFVYKPPKKVAKTIAKDGKIVAETGVPDWLPKATMVPNATLHLLGQEDESWGDREEMSEAEKEWEQEMLAREYARVVGGH